ncbi:MAG: hypothetical protein ACREJ3_14270, partial [Polyangiaceae bacterium]
MSGDREKPNLDRYAESKASELLGEVTEKAVTGGFSLRPFAEVDEPTTGIMVSLSTSVGLNLTLSLRDLTEDNLRAELKPWLKRALRYMAEHGDTYLGGWYDPEGGKLYFDVSERHGDLGRAKRLAAERNQVSVYRIDDG